MFVKVQKKESVIVKAMRTMLRREVHKLPESIIIIHNINGSQNFFRTIPGDSAFSKALGNNRRAAYFRCVCNGDPNETLPEIIEEVPNDELPQHLRV